MKQFEMMKAFLAIIAVILSSSLSVAKLEDGDCEGIHYNINRVYSIANEPSTCSVYQVFK